MSKKRVYHLITGLNVGGTENMLLKILPALESRFENRVAAITGHGPIGKELEAKGIPVFYLDLKHPFDVAAIRRFYRDLKQFKPDTLITYLIHADLFGRLWGRLFGIKRIICSQRGSLGRWEFLRYFDRLSKYLVNLYIVQTDIAKQELIYKLKLPPHKLEVVPNVIILEDFRLDKFKKEQKVKDLGLPSRNLNLVCVANLISGKGHDYLLEAFEKIYQENPHLNLLLVGDGQLRPALEESAKSLKSAKNIYFLGSRRDVKEILKISDIFIFPSLAEGMSNAVMEAMASSLPCLVSDIPANQALIQDQQNGRLFKCGSADSLSENLRALINDPSLRQKFGTASRATVEQQFSLDKVIGKLAKLIIA